MSATEIQIRHANKFINAYIAQAGESAPIGCQMAQSFRFLAADAFVGIPATTNWVEAGRRAAVRTLVSLAA